MWSCSPIRPRLNPRKLVEIEKQYILEHCTDGKTIKRSDQWRLDYLNLPYLLECPLDEVVSRFSDIQANYFTVNEIGQIGPLLSNDKGFFWMSRLTHVLEEFGLRGGIPAGLPKPPHFPPITHPDTPRGAQILSGRPLSNGPFLVKLAMRPHSEDLFKRGIVRISPASSWAAPHLNRAVQDDELHCEISIASGEKLNERVGDAEPQSDDGRIADKRRRLFLKCDDYYAYCMSLGYDYRLLDDFSYDSFVVIYDVGQFAKRLSDAVQRIYPELRMAANAVQYYDPYFCATWQLKQGFSKHLRYAYQREWRFLWEMPQKHGSAPPFFVELGSLEDIGQLYTADDQ